MSKSAVVPTVCWSESSDCIYTCHRNVPGLMAKDTQLARMWYNGGSWTAVIDATGESFSDVNHKKVKSWVHQKVGLKELSSWD